MSSTTDPEERVEGPRTGMDLATLHRRTVEAWQRRLDAVGPEQWGRPTPCAEWDVRAIANHVVGEQRWTRPLLQGMTIADVGGRFDGDLLGDDPQRTGGDAAAEAVAAVDELLDGIEKVHLSYGDEDASEFVHQLCADHLIHAWDLAMATGQDPRLEPELVADVAAWFADREELYRSAGVTGPRAAGGGDPQCDLLAAFGRSPEWRVD
jgi:uncharacterized protein (TIGR03086 family)